MTPPAVQLPAQAPAAPRLDDLHLTLAGLVLLLLWDLSGLDRAALHLVGGVDGFAWRKHALTRDLLHTGGRWAGWAMVALLALNVARPLWPGPDRAWRARWLLVTLGSLLLVSGLKQLSRTSCPWDLAEFGGVAAYLSHWTAGGDGGPGRCFPSGHAAAAFGFIGGYFVLRPHSARLARRWLLAVLAAGLLLGLGQFLRGAHPPSHTLWTAWLCWTFSALALAPGRRVPVAWALAARARVEKAP